MWPLLLKRYQWKCKQAVRIPDKPTRPPSGRRRENKNSTPLFDWNGDPVVLVRRSRPTCSFWGNYPNRLCLWRQVLRCHARLSRVRDVTVMSWLGTLVATLGRTSRDASASETQNQKQRYCLLRIKIIMNSIKHRLFARQTIFRLVFVLECDTSQFRAKDREIVFFFSALPP